MKNTFYTLLLTIGFYSHVFAQKIEVLAEAKNDFAKNKNGNFHFLNQAIDTTQLIYVAQLKTTGTNPKDASIFDLFSKLRQEATARGANAFKLLDSQISNTEPSVNTLTIIAFRVDDMILEKNLEYFPRNMIYVLGDFSGRTLKAKKVNLNDKKISLEPLKYLAYQNQIGQETTLSIGGITGMKLWIKDKEGRLPNFYTLSSFGVGLGMGSVGTIGVSFNTGRIYPMDIDFGSLLIRVLSAQKF